MERKEKVKAFFKDFKYEGELISEDEQSYTILDIKDGKIKLPKAGTVLKFLGGNP